MGLKELTIGVGQDKRELRASKGNEANGHGTRMTTLKEISIYFSECQMKSKKGLWTSGAQ